MTVFVHVKTLGKKSRKVSSIPYELSQCPQTLRELIITMVRNSVRIYNEKRQSFQSPSPRSVEELEDMASVGKIGFALPYNQQTADVDTAIASALSGFEDGLYRIFIEESEQTELDTPLNLKEGDTISILRLVMLTGGFY